MMTVNDVEIELRLRLGEARACLDKYVKSEANAEMMTVVIRTLETLIDGKPTTPMRPRHHE